MVVIRCAPSGRKHAPVYKIVVAHKDSRLTGRFIEKLGTYDPSSEKAMEGFKEERYEHWLKVGAQASDRVKKIYKEMKAGGPKKKEPKAKKAAPAPEAAPAAEESAAPASDA